MLGNSEKHEDTDTRSIVSSVPESTETGKKTDSSGDTVRNARHSIDAQSIASTRSNANPTSPGPSRPRISLEQSSYLSTRSQHRSSRSTLVDEDDRERDHLGLPSPGKRNAARQSVDSFRSVATSRSGSSYGGDSNIYTEQTNTSSSIATRSELNKQLGKDGQPHNLEIETVPCAGVRIPHGRLKGLFAFRFCVQRPGSLPNHGPKIMSHFILDLGCRHSPVSPEILEALGYQQGLEPGTTIQLLVQGISATCCVAFPGEASRLGSNFVVEGELTMYFDGRLGAPVLYVDDQGKKPAVEGIGTTIAKRKKKFHERVRSVMSVISGSGSSSP